MLKKNHKSSTYNEQAVKQLESELTKYVVTSIVSHLERPNHIPSDTAIKIKQHYLHIQSTTDNKYLSNIEEQMEQLSLLR